jgi:hypothetical protein
VHQSQLPRIVELEARDVLAGRGVGRLGEMELAAIDKCLENVLLDVEVVVAFGGLDRLAVDDPGRGVAFATSGFPRLQPQFKN